MQPADLAHYVRVFVPLDGVLLIQLGRESRELLDEFLRVMDHQEYDKGNWVNDCGCHKPPPKKPAIATTVPPKGKPAPHGQRKGK